MTKPSAFPAMTSPADDDWFTMINKDQGGAGVHRAEIMTVANARAALNPVSFIRANVNRTLTSQTASQKIFGDPTNGRVTLTSGVYVVEGALIVTGMSATSGNAQINLLGAGTATITDWLWYTDALDNTTPGTPTAGQAAYLQVANTAASTATAGTGTALGVRFKGSFNMTTGGTMIPSIALVTAAAAVIQQGSWIEFERKGAADLVSVGAWD
jgi:hypothetical protein